MCTTELWWRSVLGRCLCTRVKRVHLNLSVCIVFVFFFKFQFGWQTCIICLIFLPNWKNCGHEIVTHLINHGVDCLTSVIWPFIPTSLTVASCLYCTLLRYLTWESYDHLWKKNQSSLIHEMANICTIQTWPIREPRLMHMNENLCSDTRTHSMECTDNLYFPRISDVKIYFWMSFRALCSFSKIRMCLK